MPQPSTQWHIVQDTWFMRYMMVIYIYISCHVIYRVTQITSKCNVSYITIYVYIHVYTIFRIINQIIYHISYFRCVMRDTIYDV